MLLDRHVHPGSNHLHGRLAFGLQPFQPLMDTLIALGASCSTGISFYFSILRLHTWVASGMLSKEDKQCLVYILRIFLAVESSSFHQERDISILSFNSRRRDLVRGMP